MGRPGCPIYDCDGTGEVCTPEDCPFILRHEIKTLNEDLAQRKESSTKVNSTWWAIHDVLGGEWHPPDAEHEAKWTETHETLLAAQAVVAGRDALRVKLDAVRALQEELLYELDAAAPTDAMFETGVPELHNSVEFWRRIRSIHDRLPVLAAAGVPELPTERQGCACGPDCTSDGPHEDESETKRQRDARIINEMDADHA